MPNTVRTSTASRLNLPTHMSVLISLEENGTKSNKEAILRIRSTLHFDYFPSLNTKKCLKILLFSVNKTNWCFEYRQCCAHEIEYRYRCLVGIDFTHTME